MFLFVNQTQHKDTTQGKLSKDKSMKCKVMHFGHRNLRHKYKMNGQELQETEEEVDIGVMVTKDLKPSGQCQRAVRTAQTVLGQLARAFSYR